MEKHKEYFFAFISYKRSKIDSKIANWIHTKLEKYPYPKELVTKDNCPNHNKYIRNIFIDIKDLSVNENEFSSEIKEAIRSSRYLVVVCSKESAESTYVNNEVDYFLETHDNDLNKILPVFIDTVKDTLPLSLQNTNILDRNCPIITSFLSLKDESNLQCFYHIVAFLLKVDFRTIYDRYKRYAQRKSKRNRLIKYSIYTLIGMAMVYLILLIYSQQRIIKLEKEIFPYSVVTGYVDNFLLPVIDYMKENDENAHIYVHMPVCSDDLKHGHKDRFEEISNSIEKKLSLDSIRKVHLKTRMPRGSLVHKLYSSKDDDLNHCYLDFASTTSTFAAIAKKKKEEFYVKDEINEMIEEYTYIFISQANERLKSDSVHVTFVTEVSEILK